VSTQLKRGTDVSSHVAAGKLVSPLVSGCLACQCPASRDRPPARRSINARFQASQRCRSIPRSPLNILNRLFSIVSPFLPLLRLWLNDVECLLLAFHHISFRFFAQRRLCPLLSFLASDSFLVFPLPFRFAPFYRLFRH
jgi:hypothetical protein